MRFLIGLLLVATALAGCVDDEAYVPDEADPCIVESADDYSCLDEAPEGDPDDVAHKHDYWQGKDRMTILDAEIPTDRYLNGHIISCDGWQEYTFLAEDGFSVIQGTSAVEITMDWDDEAYDNFRDPELWIKTAAMDEPEFVQAIEPGETVVYESTNEHNDLPHSLLSAWQFIWKIYPGQPDDPFCNQWHWSGFNIQVDIVDGLEIPIFPAHPDLWDGGNITEKQVLSEEATIFHSSDIAGCLTSFDGTRCLWDPWLLDGGAIVPFDTEMITVELDVQPRQGAPFTVDLAYHGADGRELIPLEPTRTEGTVQIFEFDVERIQADGPYALQSLWEFWVMESHESEEYSGDIEMTVTVHKDAE